MIKSSLKTLKTIKHIKNFTSAKDDIAREKAYHMLENLFSEEGGLFTKFIQYQNTKSDKSAELSLKFSSHVDQKEIIKVLILEFPETYSEIKNLSENSISASIGQVHFAEYNEKKIAIKIQYLNIKEELEKQFRMLEVLPKTLDYSPIRKWGFDLTDFQNKLKNIIEQECDYELEARQLKYWHGLAQDYKDIFIPKVLDKFSNKKILTTELYSGEFIDQYIKKVSENKRRELARSMFDFYIELLLAFRITQGDTNHGNFLFNSKENTCCFLDLGQTVEFSQDFINGLKYIFKAHLIQEKVDYLKLFEMLGFETSKLESLESRLPLLVDILFKPFVADYAFDLKEWNYKKEIDLALGEEKWWFRSAGGSEFFLFMKSFMGFKNLLMKFDVLFKYKDILEPYLHQVKIPPQFLQVISKNRDKNISTHIRILLREENKEKLNLLIPFTCIYQLEELLSPETIEELRKNDIIISEIIQKALRDGGLAKVIFEGELGDRFARIELIKKEGI